MKKFLPLLCLCILLLGNVAAQTIVSTPYYKMVTWDTSPYKSYKVTGGSNTGYDMPFRLLLPKNYDPTHTKGYPLLLMLHGAGESAYGNASFGAYASGDPRRSNNDHQLHHLGKEFLNAVNSGTWPGFVVFPQNPTGQWTSDGRVLSDAVEIVKTLAKTYRIDENRISVAGLSAGALGVWAALSRYTTYFAAGTPFSGISSPSTSNTTQIVHVPVWYFQGGVDSNPSKSSADRTIQAMKDIGATPTYTVFPESGHGTWAKAVSQPNYFPFLLRANKTNIHAYFGKTEYDSGEPVNVKLGVSPGFAGYEWRKNGTLISGATGNTITATSLGSYTVRVKKGTVWTDWSNPCELKIKTPPSIATHPASVTRVAGTSVLFQVAVNGTPPFTYQWQKDGVNIPGATEYYYKISNVLKRDAGYYRVVVKNALGSTTSNSAKLSVNTALACAINNPTPGYYFTGGEIISYSGSADDSRGGDMTASQFTWKLEIRNPSGTTVVWTRTGSKTGSWQIPTSLAITNNAYYKLFLIVKDPYTSATKTLERNIHPKLTEIVLRTEPAGLKLTLDGKSLLTTKAFYAVEGTVRTLGVVSPQSLNGKTYKFSHWAHGKTTTHNFTVPVNDVTYRAVFVASTSSARLSDEEEMEISDIPLSLYPNPSTNYITIDIASEQGEKITVDIINSLGKAVAAKDFVAEAEGENSITLDVSTLQNNSYIIRVKRGGRVYFKHFLKTE